MLVATMGLNASQINFGTSVISDNIAFNTSLSFGPVAGISVTATPYTDFGSGFVTGTTAPGSTIQDYVGHGLGVCNSLETGCTSPSHQVSNGNGDDFILLTFSAPIFLQDLLLVNTGSATSGVQAGFAFEDVTYYTCSSPGTILGKTAGTAIAGCNAAVNDSPGVEYSKDIVSPAAGARPPVLINQTVSAILIGAQVADAVNDYFKIDAVDFTAATPEPATFALMGGALLALAGVRFRRKG